MERYQHIVHFSYFGHTHDETFTVVKSIEDANASIGWYLVTGSGTPGGNINPTFVSIEYDSEFKVPVNIYTYFLNLTDANENNSPKWELLHDYLSEYNLVDLSPSSMK